MLLLVGLAGCGTPAPEVDLEALLDPATCQSCHPDHHAQWSGSMHAYAARDPLFLAMNARGQRETDGELGDFCIRCHAPLAVRLGYTEDGLNLDEVPDHLEGVTCAFCHGIDEVTGDHDAAVGLALDGVMRGPIADPLETEAHGSSWSPLHDRRRLESAGMCGACHDIVTPAGVHLERTYAEWRDSLYSEPTPGRQQTCGNCHMQGRDGPAASVPGAPERRVHDHRFPAVDVALTAFPDREAQAAAVQDLLDTTLLADLAACPRADGGADITLTLENVAAGHMWPSGAAQDRRTWVELVATDGPDSLLATGVVADDQPLADLEDPNLWRFGDTLYGEGGEQVHMFWEALALTSELLPAPTAASPADPDWVDTHVRRTWTVDRMPDAVDVRVRLRPVGLDVLEDLERSGDLDPAALDPMPTFDLGSTVLHVEPGPEGAGDCSVP